MISNFVSSILNPTANAAAADKAAAHQLQDDKNRPDPTVGTVAKTVSAHLKRASIHQSGFGEQIDYYHAAKK